jgi:hypothetical protein
MRAFAVPVVTTAELGTLFACFASASSEERITTAWAGHKTDNRVLDGAESA